MGTSDITVAALATTPGVGYIDLSWTYDDPRDGALPNIALAAVEVWAASTNNRAVAVKVAEGETSARHSGVANGATWYYWIKPRNKVPSYGAFYPSSATGGISGTEATATQVTLSALTAVVNVSQASLQWVITDPSATGLGYLGLAAVEVWAASTNDRAGAAKVTEGLTSAVHDAIPEGETRYYWIRPRNRNGTFGSYFPSSSTAGVVATVRDQVGLSYGLANGRIVASVAANALTVAVKTAAGNDPSVSDPVYVAFPNSTLTIGNYQIRQIAAALSVTVSSGSELGVLFTSLPFRLWFPLFDDGGTLRLGVTLRSLAAGVILPLNDGDVASSTAEGGAGGADSDLIYTTVAVVSKPYRILGYCEFNSGLATLGTWNVAPDVVRLTVAGDKPSGLVKELSSSDSVNSGTTLIPWDSSIPQIGEGTSLFGGATLDITPRSAANWFEIDCTIYMSHSVGALMVLALFRDGANDAIAAAVGSGAADQPTSVKLKARILAGSAAQRSFSLRFGSPTAGTVTVNGSGGAEKLGGILRGHVRIAELWG